MSLEIFRTVWAWIHLLISVQDFSHQSETTQRDLYVFTATSNCGMVLLLTCIISFIKMSGRCCANTSTNTHMHISMEVVRDESISSEEGLRDLGLLSLEKRCPV